MTIEEPQTVTEAAPWPHALGELLSGADERLVARSRERARDATAAPIPDALHPAVREALERTAIDSLYSHQADAWQSVMHGGHTIVTTGTASGKSLCFNLPALHVLSSDPRARALYIYPAKALAQDQARALSRMRVPALRHAIYDGDTPSSERPPIRRQSNLVLTNPDMLHIGILPHHDNWGDFFANLALVVVDEAHIYRGVFGSHVANVLRRLRRLARAYGTEPRFVLASATIANPLELASELTGLGFRLLDTDGAASSEREILMCNPPLLDPHSGRRASPLSEAAALFADLVSAGVRTICFARSRRGAELIYRFAAERMRSGTAAERPSYSAIGREEGRSRAAIAPDRAPAAIAPYRAGYTPEQRREIEAQLASGELAGVVSTNALELGIDIGHLDAAISVTFPGTVASLRQQWGRAGRRDRGLAVYVAGEDGLDQFFCRHPEEFLGRPVEAAILDHSSQTIYMRHLLAAAYEAPLEPTDSDILGPELELFAERLVSAGELRKASGRYVPRQSGFPAGKFSLRSASTDAFAVVDATEGEVIGRIEAERVFSTAHPGAIYLHRGDSYEIEDLDLEARRVIACSCDVDYYTQPKIDRETFIEETREQREALGVTLSFGIVSVSEQVIAYQRKRLADHQVIDLRALDLPEQNFVTQALWYEVDEARFAGMPLEAVIGALHASEHSQIAVLPLIAMCDRWDIGGLSINCHHQTGCPTIFIYDGHPGGVGIARRGYEQFERLVSDALGLVSECPCESGCPSCVQSPKCGNLNESLSKQGCIDLMGEMLAAQGASR